MKSQELLEYQELKQERDELLYALLKVQTDMLRTDFKNEKDRCGYVLGYVTDALQKATSSAQRSAS